MPILEFACLNCDAKFEFFKIRADERVQCPNCGNDHQERLKKLISQGTSFQLNGPGWYKDAYRGSGSGQGSDK